MSKLNSKARNALADSTFALPGERKYPLPDVNHARAALSRVSANGTPAEKATVQAAVHKKYPEIDKTEFNSKKPRG